MRGYPPAFRTRAAMEAGWMRISFRNGRPHSPVLSKGQVEGMDVETIPILGPAPGKAGGVQMQGNTFTYNGFPLAVIEPAGNIETDGSADRGDRDQRYERLPIDIIVHSHEMSDVESPSSGRRGSGQGRQQPAVLFIGLAHEISRERRSQYQTRRAAPKRALEIVIT